MKAVKWIAIVIGTLVAVFFVGAALINPAYKVERTAVINRLDPGAPLAGGQWLEVAIPEVYE